MTSWISRGSLRGDHAVTVQFACADPPGDSVADAKSAVRCPELEERVVARKSQVATPKGQAIAPKRQAVTPKGQAVAPKGQAIAPEGQAAAPRAEALSRAEAREPKAQTGPSLESEALMRALAEGPVLGDGAMGTLLLARGVSTDVCLESLNL